jgi:hypothetical protein
MLTVVVTAGILATEPRIINPCKATAVSFIEIPPVRETIIELEPRRFAAVTGTTVEYNLGRKKITIRANGRRVEEFFDDVAHGRCGFKLKVRLTPEHESQFTASYKATFQMCLPDVGSKGHNGTVKHRKDLRQSGIGRGRGVTS